MIFQSFLLGNLAPLCIKISNSVVVVGLYYGFLTTFSIGPSYLFLLGTQIIEKEPENKVSAATGFIMGQLVMFISIYYAPLHLALGRPHTITFLGLLYLLFQFFWNNFHQDETWYWTYEIVTETTMFSIQCVFLNHLIFQLFNHCLFAGSMLARLVNIDMFRCNNKMLFVISSFVGWLIGHILFTKWLGLVLVWMQKNPSIRRIIRENRYKYLVFEYVDLADYLEFRSQYVSLILVITCCYYLNKMPSPIAFKFTEAKEKTATYGEKARREIEWWKEGEERDVEIERADNSRFKKNQKPKNRISFEEILISFFFDPNRPGRPIRYVKEAVRTEISQYFFDICKSDENERISFTSTPSLSIFLEMIKKRISGKKASPYNPWRYHLKRKGFTDDLLYRIKGLDEKSRPLNMLETRTRLCKNPYTKEYLAKKYDPFLKLAIPGETDDEKKRETSDIRTRKAVCDVEFDTRDSAKASGSTNNQEPEELYFLRYIRRHDWEQDIIKGSLRTLRRKVATLTLYYKDPNTPLFFPYNSRSLFSVVTGGIFTILYEELSDLKWSEILSKAKAKREKIIEKIWGKRKEKSEHEEIEEIEAEVGETETTTEDRRMDIVDSWDFIPHGMLIRSGLLCFQCLFRMYGVPLLIIAKNFVLFSVFHSKMRDFSYLLCMTFMERKPTFLLVGPEETIPFFDPFFPY
ncbi:Ycf1 protein [Striga asiatica]|uniref:Protein TIC 214 n=1 Tax=Striga asiatica TaxID=4170 RepID=A0A5A7PBP1_STRAF|nr:Ycf1 protein [Striga asiatica]